MRITILCVGKLRERFYQEAVKEYQKRLGRYVRLTITEVPDEPAPDSASPKEEDKIRKTEGKRLMKHIQETDTVVALAIKGTSYDSLAFSKKLNDFGIHGCQNLVFVIGGSLGLSPEVMERADETVSFSAFTFPHPLMRVILLEQIYRGYRIIKKEPYHK